MPPTASPPPRKCTPAVAMDKLVTESAFPIAISFSATTYVRTRVQMSGKPFDNIELGCCHNLYELTSALVACR